MKREKMSIIICNEKSNVWEEGAEEATFGVYCSAICIGPFLMRIWKWNVAHHLIKDNPIILKVLMWWQRRDKLWWLHCNVAALSTNPPHMLHPYSIPIYCTYLPKTLILWNVWHFYVENTKTSKKQCNLLKNDGKGFFFCPFSARP